MKLTTLSTPKISVSPTATRNSSMPMMRPLVVCVTRQAELARQPVSASRSKRKLPQKIRYGRRRPPARERDTGRRRQLDATPALADLSGVTLALLPLGFEFQNGLPVTRLDLRHVGLLRDGRAPADRVADQ